MPSMWLGSMAPGASSRVKFWYRPPASWTTDGAIQVVQGPMPKSKSHEYSWVGGSIAKGSIRSSGSARLDRRYSSDTTPAYRPRPGLRPGFPRSRLSHALSRPKVRHPAALGREFSCLANAPRVSGPEGAPLYRQPEVVSMPNPGCRAKEKPSAVIHLRGDFACRQGLSAGQCHNSRLEKRGRAGAFERPTSRLHARKRALSCDSGRPP